LCDNNNPQRGHHFPENTTLYWMATVPYLAWDPVAHTRPWIAGSVVRGPVLSPSASGIHTHRGQDCFQMGTAVGRAKTEME
jgi:hypothetical protein